METEGMASTTELTVANPNQEVTGDNPTTAGTGTDPSTTPTAIPVAQLECLDLFSETTVQQLSDGFLHIFQPELLQVQDSLRELTVNQEEMLRSIQDKRVGLEEMTNTSRITSTLQKVPTYKAKLVALNKQMQQLSKKVKRLQARAAKLKEGRVQREAMARKELERKAQQERMLEAKPAR